LNVKATPTEWTSYVFSPGRPWPRPMCTSMYQRVSRIIEAGLSSRCSPLNLALLQAVSAPGGTSDGRHAGAKRAGDRPGLRTFGNCCPRVRHSDELCTAHTPVDGPTGTVVRGPSSVLLVLDCQTSAQPRWIAIVSALQVEATTEKTSSSPLLSRPEQATWDAARQCLAFALQCELRGTR